MIELMIIDFDDTLIDNKVLDYRSFTTICKKFNCYIPTKSEIYFLRQRGYLAQDIIDWIYDRSKNGFDRKYFLNLRRRVLESRCSINFLRLRPHVRYILKMCKKNKIKIVIATLRKKERIIKLFLKKEKIDSNIDMIYNVKNKINTRKLPNAIKEKKKIYKKIIQRYDIDTKRIVSIGDAKADLIAAKTYEIKHLMFDKSHYTKKSHTINSFIEIKRFI